MSGPWSPVLYGIGKPGLPGSQTGHEITTEVAGDLLVSVRDTTTEPKGTQY